MSDAAPDINQTTIEAPDDGASLVPAAEPAEAPPTEGEQAPPQQFPWSAEHPEWGPEDAWKAYGEARSFISRGEHQQPAEEEQPYDPYTELPAGDDPALVQDLADIFGGQKTFQDGTYGPQAVMQWLAKSEALSETTRGQFLQAWAQQNPWAAQTWVARHAYSSERESIREELRQEYAPAMEATWSQTNGTALALAKQEIPDFEEVWAEKIGGYIANENPSALLGPDGKYLRNPHDIAERLCDIAGILAAREQRAQRRATPAQPASQPAAAAATQTTSRAPNGQFTAREKHSQEVLQSLRTLQV